MNREELLELVQLWREEAGEAETEASERLTRLMGGAVSPALTTAAKCLRSCADELERIAQEKDEDTE